jgi:hypothetical protein
MLTALRIITRFAEDMASLGHDGDLTIRVPPNIFGQACDEAKHLMRFPAYLPGATTITAFGAGDNPPPSVLRFAAPCGEVTVIPEAAD